MRSLLALCLLLMLLSVHADARHVSVLGAGGGPFGSGGSGDATTGLLPSYADANPNWAKAGLQTVGGISGVESGWTQCGLTLTPLGGISDDYSQIQTAINNCTANHYVLLSGKFQIKVSDGALNIAQSNIALRGSGTCNNSVSPYCPTSITVMDGALPYTAFGGNAACGTIGGTPGSCPNGGPPVIFMGTVEPSAGSVGWGTCGTGSVATSCGAVALAVDAAQGATSVQLGSTTGFAVGQYVLIDEASGAGWVADPMSATDGWANVYAAPEFLNSSGSPAAARIAWSKFENAGGTSFGGDLGSGLPSAGGSSGCWFSFCDRPTAEIHKVTAVGSSCPGAGCTLTFDDPLTIGFRAGHSAQVYPPEVSNCNGCAWAIGDNMVQNVGLENISIMRGPTGGVLMRFCRYCFVDNTEISEWYGGGISVQYSLRSELNTILAQRCWWCTNNGGEYPLDISDAATEILVTNSITQYAGKGMVMRAGGAGSVISYNDFDRTLYTESPSDVWVEMSANASHYIGPHHVLFEGNRATNLDNDNTHGSSGYETYYRNLSTGFRSKFTDPSNGTIVDDANSLPGSNGPFRAAGAMAYNYWDSWVGNVLGVSGKTTTGNGWVYSSNCGWCSASIFMLGWNTGTGGADPYLNGTNGSYWFYHGNYDYVNSAVTWNPGNGNHTLTNSFYTAAAPSFFTATGCTYSWPWVTPTGGSQFTTNSCGGPGLPAQARADAGTPFVNPTTNGNSIFGAFLSQTSFTTGTAGTVGALSPELSSGTFSGTYAVVSTGTDAFGVTCNNYGTDFSISGSNLNYSAAAPAQSYPGVCVSLTQSGALNSPFVEAFNLTGTAPTNYFSVIAHGGGTSTTGNGVTSPALNTTGANLIVVTAANTFPAQGTLTDTSGNTWSPITAASGYGGPPWNAQMFYCAPCTTSSSDTFTYSESSSFPSIEVIAFADSHGTPTLDQHNSAPQNSSGVTSIQPGSVTPTVANELLVTGLAHNVTSGTITINSSFTIADQIAPIASEGVGSSEAYVLDGTSGPTNPAWALPSSDTPGAAIATFNP